MKTYGFLKNILIIVIFFIIIISCKSNDRVITDHVFCSAFRVKNDSDLPDTWMNDIGEKIPNWFESARLYYAYTGDTSVMKIIHDFMDYTLEHGTSSPEYD